MIVEFKLLIMKAIYWTLLLSCLPFYHFAQTNETNDFLSKWDGAIEFTIQVVELIPEEKFDFAATPETQSFETELTHMINNMIWLSTSYLTEADFKKREVSSKMEYIKYVQEVGAFVKEAIKTASPNHDEEVNFFAGPMSKRKVILLIFDHLTHHRAQLMVNLRLNGIKPPKYVGW